MGTLFRSFIIVLVLLGISLAAQAQFHWQLTHTDYDGRYYYMFNELSCLGNNCTAAGALVDELNEHVTLKLWRSEDGGKSWVMQNPGIKPYTNLSKKEYFTDVQQIDPLNVVAIGVTWEDSVGFGELGDSGLVVRSFDGGKTWQKQANLVNGIIRKVHFSDPFTGIILAQENLSVIVGEGNVRTYVTTDGGVHWDSVSIGSSNIHECHSYGGGTFRVFGAGHGTIYTTHDSWKTFDSTQPIFNGASDPNNWYYLSGCNFSGGDTILAYGNYRINGSFLDYEGVIVRSTNGGTSWEQPKRFSASLSSIRRTTSLSRDTVFAGGTSTNKILMSTDHGMTWRVDTLKIDTAYAATNCFGLAMTGDELPLAIYSPNDPNTPSIIIRGVHTPSSVKFGENIMANISIFPNPTATRLNISSQPFCQIRIIDILGREVMKGKASAEGTLTFDVSSLARGVYIVTTETFGSQYVIGRVSIVED